MRQFICGVVAIAMHVVVTASASAQVCSRPKGTYETFGDIVVDKTSHLAWKRCSIGQSWNGASCFGQPAAYTYKEVLTVSAPAADGFVWRVPRADELATLVIENASCTPAIDQEAFPRTIPGTYWTAQAVPKASDAAYCQSFGLGASISQREQCWAAREFPVRLVSTLPLRPYSPVAPAAASINVDDSGTQLVVMGSNFSRTIADNLVNFPTTAGVKSVVPSAASTVSLTATIPDDATTGTITVTTRGVTSQPAPGTLRVINDKEGCAAAGFTPATIPQSEWDYCVLSPTFQDTPADVLIVGAHPGKLSPRQPSYMLSTSPLAKAAAARFMLSGRIVLQYSATGAYGVLVIESNAGQQADSLTTAGTLTNRGAIDNRGTFINTGSLLNVGNGVIFNSGAFTNNPTPENGFSIATTGRAISNVSFSNGSGPGWPRAQLKNLGTLATDSGSTGIENLHGDITNNGTLLLEGAEALVNRSGSAPGTITNNGSIVLKIGTQPEGIPILSNEPGATIINTTGGSIANAQTIWTFVNNGTVQNCGKMSGYTPGPNGYATCTPRKGPDGRSIR